MVLLGGFFVVPLAHADTAGVGCQQDIPFEHDGLANSVFGNSERIDYVNGYLVVHFQITRDISGQEDWSPSFTFVDDQCHTADQGGYLKISNPENAPFRNLSVRFISPTQFIFWNDDTDTRFICGSCQGNVVQTGQFFKIRLNMYAYDISNLVGFFSSSAHTIVEQPSPAPILTTTLPSTPGCPTFSTTNSMLDGYEHAEYVGGTLRIHFRRAINQAGDPSDITLTSYGPGCTNPQPISYGFQLAPSRFIQYFSIRFTDASHFELWNDDLEQPMNCDYYTIVCNGTMNTVPAGGLVSLGIAANHYWYTASAHSTAFPIKTPPPDPVIIIPGILGSWEKNGQWVIDPVLHTYDNLINNLAGNGYEQGKTLFTFPYQWRDSNVQTALLLKQKIADVKAICQCTKVDLVAHSMGGLVARQYIQSDDYQHDVDQLIFLGTPHLGAPKDYLTWEGAELGNTFADFLMEFLLSREATKGGYSSAFNYIRNRPIASVQELLPISDYLRDDATDLLRTYSTNYPRNPFLEDLDRNKSKLDTSSVRMINIVGDLGLSSTISQLRVVDSPTPGLWEHGYPKDFDSTPEHGLINGVGDGTVPLNSAEGVAISDTRIVAAEHKQLVTQVEDQIIGALTPKQPLVLVDNTYLQNAKLLFLKMLSPADFQVIAPDGKRIGKDFTTGQEINEIPDAFYSGFLTDDEYIAIPNPLDGEYKIQTQGTGTGEYTVASGFITASTLAEQDFTGNTVPGATNELDVAINNQQPEHIVVVPADTTPPSITITSPIAQNYARSSTLSIATTVTDSSGVARERHFFDSRPVSNSVDLFFEKLGSHTVTVQATDTVNNTASKSMSFTIIATSDSGISDTNRAYGLAWIKTARVRDTIIKDFQMARDNTRKRASMLSTLSGYLDTQYTKKTINQQAHDLLKEDVVWLQTH